LSLQDIFAYFFTGLLNLADGNHVIRGAGVDSQDLHNGKGDAARDKTGNRDSYYQLNERKTPLTFI
jgi:hypothetical protein